MKRFLSVLLVLCGLGTTLASYAEKADATKPTNVEANKMEYDDKAEIMKLFVKARMRRLENGKPTDEVEGEFISYDTRAEFFTVHNTASGDSKQGGGRIKAVIQPRAADTKAK